MDVLDSFLGGLIGGGAAFGALVWLLKTLIGKRLDHEFATRLAAYQSSLQREANTEVESVKAVLQQAVNTQLEGYKASLQREVNTELERLKSSLQQGANTELEYLKALLQREGNTELERLKASLQYEGTAQLEHLKAALQHDYASRLEHVKQDLAKASQYELQVLAPRLKSYRTLWALTGQAAFGAVATPDSCHALAADMQSWYYSQGNGIFLSFRAAELFLRAKTRLAGARPDVNIAREDLSALRTQLKNDLRVYDEITAQTELDIAG